MQVAVVLQMPDFSSIHTLSVSTESITAMSMSSSGDWLALGCAALGQLLVWEWRSETYVLKQQGHYYDISCVAFSPDAAYIATGADDSKVKICTQSFCDHQTLTNVNRGMSKLFITSVRAESCSIYS